MNGKKGKQGKVSKSGLSAIDFKLTFNIGDKVIEIDIDDKLHIPSIDVLTPQKACNLMAENPAIHARWNVLSNQAAVKADLEKVKFEVWVKKTSKHYRVELAETTGKRVTDKMTEEAVLTDPEYIRKYQIYLSAKEDAANMKSIAMGFGERGDRLVNITSMMKSEKPNSGIKNMYADMDDDTKEKNAFSDEDE